MQFAPCGSNYGHIEDPRLTKFIQDEKLDESMLRVDKLGKAMPPGDRSDLNSRHNASSKYHSTRDTQFQSYKNYQTLATPLSNTGELTFRGDNSKLDS